MREYNANLPWPMRDLTSKKHLVKENHPAELRPLGIHKMYTHTLLRYLPATSVYCVCLVISIRIWCQNFPLISDNLPSNHSTMNYKLQPFQCLFPQTNFKSFFKEKVPYLLYYLWISFFFSTESGHCLLTDQIIKIIMTETIVQPFKEAC